METNVTKWWRSQEGLCFLKLSALLLHNRTSGVGWVWICVHLLPSFGKSKWIYLKFLWEKKTLPNCFRFTDTVQRLHNWNRPPHSAGPSRHVGCLVQFKGFLLLSSVEPCVGVQHRHISTNWSIHSEVEEEIVSANWQGTAPCKWRPNFLLWWIHAWTLKWSVYLITVSK